MRCAVCAGPLLYDRIENESRCLICGRIAKQRLPKHVEAPERKRQEYPRRFDTKTQRESKQDTCESG